MCFIIYLHYKLYKNIALHAHTQSAQCSALKGRVRSDRALTCTRTDPKRCSFVPKDTTKWDSASAEGTGPQIGAKHISNLRNNYHPASGHVNSVHQ